MERGIHYVFEREVRRASGGTFIRDNIDPYKLPKATADGTWIDQNGNYHTFKKGDTYPSWGAHNACEKLGICDPNNLQKATADGTWIDQNENYHTFKKGDTYPSWSAYSACENTGIHQERADGGNENFGHQQLNEMRDNQDFDVTSPIAKLQLRVAVTVH
eukprot:scaffold10568_cov64-Cyclotella_meneghiniana.AAC.12